MDNFTPFSALVGGALIGLSATLLMWFNGRIAGISGIFYGAFEGKQHDTAWRWWFILGLLVGAGLYLNFGEIKFVARSDFPLPLVALSGLIVGYGTRMGSGCTSGHGVCGIARFSMRSILATITFIVTGAATTFVVRHVFGVTG